MDYNKQVMNKLPKNATDKATADKATANKTIAVNRQARYEYTLEQRYEAGIVLEGWEVKSLRAGKIQIAESYILLKKGEAWLIGSHISPLLSASTHVKTDPTRTRKLLLHRKELTRLIGLIERRGYTLIPLSLYWCKGHVKLEIGLAKGKKQHDKRASEKERDWQREKQRLFKSTKTKVKK
jgi:SsrA-binding protein